jgi:probable HAF family extracellular repeat protein
MKKISAIAQTFIFTSFSALSLLAIAPVQAASFAGLGGPYSPSGVSADGSVIVGYYHSAYVTEAFRWTQETGMVGLGFLAEDDQYSQATDVSADGSVVVGTNTKTPGFRHSPFRWTQETGMVDLGSYPDGWFGWYDLANGVSADGSVIVGRVDGLTNQAFRWTQSSGVVGLGDLAGGSFDSSATDVSADGSVIVGYGNSVNGREAFRWTQETGMVGLGTVPSGGSIGSFLGISADSSVIVGYDYSANGTEAFRWTQETGMVGLGTLPDGDPNYGGQYISTSANGSIIVGASTNKAFHWTQKTGMVSLKETLIGAGLDVSGWSLTSANAISADGFTIVGNGINPSGQSEAWVANLEPIPEPLTILGSIAAIAFAAGFERKFGKNKSDEKDPEA